MTDSRLGSLACFVCYGNAAVLLCAEVADWLAALGTGSGVLHTARSITTIGTGKGDGSTFDGMLACRIVLRDY